MIKEDLLFNKLIYLFIVKSYVLESYILQCMKAYRNYINKGR